MIKSSRVLSQGYTNYCIYYSCWSLFETLSNTEIPDGWQKVQELSNKYSSAGGGTVPQFLEGLKVEGLNGFKIKDYKILDNTTDIKKYIDLGLPVICDFTEIWGIPYHTCVAEAYNDLELYLKNSYGSEWGNGGYQWSGVNPEPLKAYVAIPLDQVSVEDDIFVQYAPLDIMEITQPYGFTEFAKANPDLYKSFGGIHPGWDLRAYYRQPVRSAETRCEVIFAGWDNGWGNCVRTSEGNRMIIYAHLDECAVRAGDVLTRNQIIGFAGSTGNSTGIHLHYGIFLDNIGWVDPYGFAVTNLVR